MIRADFVLRHAGQLATMVPEPDDPLGRLTDAALAARDGLIVWLGKDRDLEAAVRLDGDLLDAQGACVIPGLVDAHTHPVFAGDRADEFAERVAGVPYASQQSEGRGIQRTVRATRGADEATLLELAMARADRFLAHGTTTIEAKSGYGLNPERERTSLLVLRQLAARTSLRVVPTFLGAHVVPDGIEREAYLRSLLDDMLPNFAGLASFCDAWCEAPAFTAEEVRQVLTRARALGYQLRVHAAQLAEGEGPEIAAELGAASADHLEYVTRPQIDALVRAGTVGVLCPAANFTVPQSRRPPIEAMREAGLPLAIASDLNPGTANSESLTFAMSVACADWGMTPTEVLQGATRQAARSLRLERAGVLRRGSLADCAVFDVERPEAIPYYVGVNRVRATVVRGRVWANS
ncbi:MAG: imidazolonepropionase [Candidatus Dormibacteraeota bacterium]|nr:imidazolonepropionase [Candidatus Dormibacteraeota bacterium]